MLNFIKTGWKTTTTWVKTHHMAATGIGIGILSGIGCAVLGALGSKENPQLEPEYEVHDDGINEEENGTGPLSDEIDG